MWKKSNSRLQYRKKRQKTPKNAKNGQNFDFWRATTLSRWSIAKKKITVSGLDFNLNFFSSVKNPKKLGTMCPGCLEWPPLGSNFFWGGSKKIFSPDFISTNHFLQVDTSYDLVSFLIAEILPLEIWAYPKLSKIWNARSSAPRGPGSKIFYIF